MNLVVNMKAELEIELLHDKLDHLSHRREQELSRMIKLLRSQNEKNQNLETLLSK